MNKRDVLSHIAVGLGAIVSSISIYSWATNDNVKSVDDVVDAINGISRQIETNRVSATSVSQTELISSALSQVALLSSQDATQAAAEGAGYLRVSYGVFDLSRNQAVDLEAPGGAFRSFGFVGFTGGTLNNGASVNFGGKPKNYFKPGDVLRFDGNDAVCEITPVQFFDFEGTQSARFRFRCG